LVAGGEFKTKFAQSNQNENTKSEFNAMMYQRAGIGEEIAPTVEVNEVLQRVKKFSSIVFDHPVAYEVEVAMIPCRFPCPRPKSKRTFSSLSATRKKRNCTISRPRTTWSLRAETPSFSKHFLQMTFWQMPFRSIQN
jgi:hypothetical protein